MKLNFLGKKEWESVTTGDNYSFRTREIKSRFFGFKLNLEGEKNIYYIRVKGTPNQLKLTLMTSEIFNEKQAVSNFGLGLLFGLVGTMVIYNFFIFFSMRSISYLFYVFFVFFYGMVFLTFYGFTQRFILPESTWISNNGITLMVSLSILFLSLFNINFLELKKRHPILFKIHVLLYKFTGNIFFLHF